jgi:hypothetical protein
MHARPHEEEIMFPTLRAFLGAFQTDLGWLWLWVVMAVLVWFLVDRSVKGPRQGGGS